MIVQNKDKISYGKYLIAWVSLILIAILQVVLSGIKIGNATAFFILLLSSVSVFTIISVYMNDKGIKYLTPIFVLLFVLELLIFTIV